MEVNYVPVLTSNVATFDNSFVVQCLRRKIVQTTLPSEQIPLLRSTDTEILNFTNLDTITDQY